MFAALLALALAASPQPTPTRHFVLHVGGHTLVKLPRARMRSYFFMRGGVVMLEHVHDVKKSTVMTLTATSPGSTAITVGCDNGGKEIWLVDVR